MRLRVLSYNIHKGFTAGNRRFVLGGMRELIRSSDADLVLLQEVVGSNRRHARRIADWPEVSQFEFLADKLWPHHAYGRNAVSADGDHGNAILSKHAFTWWENLDLSTNSLIRRGLLHGVIELPGMPQPLHVICIHLDLHEWGRTRQVAMIGERIAAAVPPDAPLLIAGDLNDWKGKAGRAFERALGLTEAHKTVHGRNVRSFPSWLPLLSLDRIYTRGLIVHSAVRLDAPPGNPLSDHAALLAEFELPG